MRTVIKNIVLTLIFQLIVLAIYSQDSDSIKSDNKKTFMISFTRYNHAEKIYDGTWTYSVKENVLEIKRRSLFVKKDSLIFKLTLDIHTLTNIKTFNLGSLSNYYFNKCVMPTSGDEYFISYINGSTEKQVHLHHYYHALVEQLVNELNLVIPKEFKIRYLTKDTKQDCE